MACSPLDAGLLRASLLRAGLPHHVALSPWLCSPWEGGILVDGIPWGLHRYFGAQRAFSFKSRALAMLLSTFSGCS